MRCVSRFDGKILQEELRSIALEIGCGVCCETFGSVRLIFILNIPLI